MAFIGYERFFLQFSVKVPKIIGTSVVAPYNTGKVQKWEKSTYIGSERFFLQFSVKVPKIIGTSVVAPYNTGKVQKWDQNGFGNKNLANNYQIWTLRFLPFPVSKSLALSMELIGGFVKKFFGN